MSERGLGTAEIGYDTSQRGCRSAVRQACNGNLLIRLVIRPSFHNLKAYLHDISSTGVALILDRPLRRGSLIALQLRPERHKMCPIMKARVARSTPHREGWYLVACELFHHLQEAELERLMED